MKLRYLFLANTIVSLLIAAGMLLMPSVVLNLLNISDNASARVLAQLIGVELVINGLLTLFAMASKEMKGYKPITLSNFIGGLIGVMISLGGTLTGAINEMGWVLALVYLIVAGGFGYFHFGGSAN